MRWGMIETAAQRKSKWPNQKLDFNTWPSAWLFSTLPTCWSATCNWHLLRAYCAWKGQVKTSLGLSNSPCIWDWLQLVQRSHLTKPISEADLYSKPTLNWVKKDISNFIQQLHRMNKTLISETTQKCWQKTYMCNIARLNLYWPTCCFCKSSWTITYFRHSNHIMASGNPTASKALAISYSNCI